MALTDQQMMDVRRYIGYPLAGTSMQITPDQDILYMNFGLTVMSLYTRLTTLSAVEESTLISVYLTNLATLETAIVSASSNLDTDTASVWKHNANEVADRASLFDQWRRRLCGFIGIAPGPALGTGGLTMVRG